MIPSFLQCQTGRGGYSEIEEIYSFLPDMAQDTSICSNSNQTQSHISVDSHFNHVQIDVNSNKILNYPLLGSREKVGKLNNKRMENFEFWILFWQQIENKRWESKTSYFFFLSHFLAKKGKEKDSNL